MRKLLVALLLILPALSIAGTEYRLDNYPVTQSSGFDRRNPKVAMTSGGDIAVLFAQNRPTDIWWVASMTQMDGVWDYDTIKTSTTSNDPFSECLSFGDSAIVMIHHPSTMELLLAKWSGASFAKTLTDSVTYTGYSGVSGSPNGAFMLHGGGKILLLHREETGTTDTVFAVLSTGALSQTTDWIKIDSFINLGTAYSVPFSWSGGTKGGLLLANINRSVHWVDTAGGLDTIHTGFMPYTGNLTTSFNVAQRSDSNGLLAQQMANTAGNDHLYSKRFKVSGTGGGSGTITFIDSAKIEDAANIPDGFHWNPYYSVLSPDSIVLWSLYWANPANTDSADVVYRISTDSGKTWGPRNIAMPAVDGKKRFNLQAPPRIYNISNYIRLAVVVMDSVATNDTLRAFLDSISAATPAPDSVTGLYLDSAHNDYIFPVNENDLIEFGFTTPSSTTADSIIMRISNSAYQTDSSTGGTSRIAMVYPGALTAVIDTLILNGTEPYTAYITVWVLDNDYGWSKMARAQVSFGASDETPPDDPSFFEIVSVIRIDPDSLLAQVGSVTAADYGRCMIRGDTAAIPTDTTAGFLLYDGGPKEDTTFRLAVSVTQPDWYYVTFFVMDEVPNVGYISDSTFFPPGGGGAAAISKMYEYLMGLQIGD